METTLILIKPDGVQRSLSGEILSRLEKSGLKICGLKLIHVDEKLAKQHYAEHEGKPFFKDLKKFMTSGPVFVQVLEGENAVQKNRDLMGSTNPKEAAPGTIRADFANSIDANAVHGSDSVESAKREIEYFFNTEEILNK